MAKYEVRWSMAVEAENPSGAAVKALETLRTSKEGQEVTFRVYDEPGPAHRLVRVSSNEVDFCDMYDHQEALGEARLGPGYFGPHLWVNGHTLGWVDFFHASPDGKKGSTHAPAQLIIGDPDEDMPLAKVTVGEDGRLAVIICGDAEEFPVVLPFRDGFYADGRDQGFKYRENTGSE